MRLYLKIIVLAVTFVAFGSEINICFLQQTAFAQGGKIKTRTKKDATKHDFEGIGVSGTRKTPLSSLISKSKANKDYDFVKIRRSWHPEMIQSTTSLDSSSKRRRK